MIINHDLQFIFVHIGKTGGTSIESTLCEMTGMDFDLTHANPEISAGDCKHLWTRHLRPIVGEKVWRDYFKFAFVRHPCDWLLSLWCMHAQENRPLSWINPEWKRFDDFGAFLDAIDRGEPLLDGVQSQEIQIVDEAGQLEVDFVGRFERLQQDFDAVCARLGLPPTPLAQRAVTRHAPFESYYDDRRRQAVYRNFPEDFRRFGYGSGLTIRHPLYREDPALTALLATLRANPRDTEGLMRLGERYLAAEAFESAAIVFKAAHDLDPLPARLAKLAQAVEGRSRRGFP